MMYEKDIITKKIVTMVEYVSSKNDNIQLTECI